MEDNDFKIFNGSTHDLNNDKDGNLPGPSTITLLNCFLNIPLILISILGNSLVLAAVHKAPSLRSPSITLLCGLAVSDLFVGFIVQPIYITKELTSAHFIPGVTKILGVTFCGISFATMSAISLDRFLALKYHMIYNSLVTTMSVKVTLIFIWLVNFSIFSGVHVWYAPEQFYISFGLIGFYMVISTMGYVGVYRIARRHQFEIHAQQQAMGVPKLKITSNVAFLTRTAVNTFVFYICTVFCYLPWSIYRLFYSDILLINTSDGWIFTCTLVFANSAINPLLYCWRLRELRGAVLKLLGQISCNYREQVENM
ncbi:histamine H2 receptor-like [Stylophora pistillata]|uniref:histamine H2 receptor-like n=1 Tax=Stylophora pistillata TaxID=50429 RepID=UPI000C053ADA|nr:histamine H2 receptor-like [Stylophora pistillata]